MTRPPIGARGLWVLQVTKPAAASPPKSAVDVFAALKSIRARRADRDPIFVIFHDLSAHKGIKIREWAARTPLALSA